MAVCGNIRAANMIASRSSVLCPFESPPQNGAVPPSQHHISRPACLDVDPCSACTSCRCRVSLNTPSTPSLSNSYFSVTSVVVLHFILIHLLNFNESLSSSGSKRRSVCSPTNFGLYGPERKDPVSSADFNDPRARGVSRSENRPLHRTRDTLSYQCASGSIY